MATAPECAGGWLSPSFKLSCSVTAHLPFPGPAAPETELAHGRAGAGTARVHSGCSLPFPPRLPGAKLCSARAGPSHFIENKTQLREVEYHVKGHPAIEWKTAFEFGAISHWEYLTRPYFLQYASQCSVLRAY